MMSTQRLAIRHWPPRALLLLILFGLAALPTARAQAGKVTNTNVPCQVNGANAELERAICNADSVKLEEALRPIGASGQIRPEYFIEAIPVLERLWMEDGTLGQGIRWNEIRRADFRAVLVQYLAQAVRNGQSQIDITELQEFAIKYSEVDILQGFTLGLRLIGLTDAPGQVPLLKSIILDTERHEGQRIQAILTLGDLCDPAADRLLHDLQGEDQISSKEKEFARDALSMRLENRKVWCKPVKVRAHT